MSFHKLCTHIYVDARECVREKSKGRSGVRMKAKSETGERHTPPVRVKPTCLARKYRSCQRFAPCKIDLRKVRLFCSPRGLLTKYSHLYEILSQARFIGIEQWNAGRFMNCSESPTYRVFPGDEYQIHLGSGGRLNPTPTPSVHFKTKMAARNGRCSVSAILRENREL